MATPFCTKLDMEKVMGLNGLIAFSDHDGTEQENDDVIDDCRQQATDELEGYLVPLYKRTELITSATVTRWTAIIAVFYLCQSRGNDAPTSLYAAYERIMGDNGVIHDAMTQKYRIPGIDRTDTNAPAFSNLTIDRRYRREKIRVISANSSPIQSKLEQDKAPEITLDN